MKRSGAIRLLSRACSGLHGSPLFRRFKALTNRFHTRELSRDDMAAVATILDKTGLFPSEMLPEMAEPFLGRTEDHLWLVISDTERLLGFAYSEPERMTDNTYNLLAIAVLPERQGEGIGKALVQAVEWQLADAGGRILIVETSSLDEYQGTRAFYDGQGFVREALIREFYAAGEDKVVFWKKL